MQITAPPLVSVLPDIGSRVLARLANAMLWFSGMSVSGVLSDAPVDLMVGGAALQGRRKRFICLSSDLQAAAPGADVGTPCTLLGVDWLIASPGPVPHTQTGQVSLILERAA